MIGESSNIRVTQKADEEITKLRPEHGYKRIGILDDEKDVTTTFRTILESDLVSKGESTLRFKVTTFNNPIEFLYDFEPGSYDLLLIDINMPGMDGFEISRKLLEIDLNLRICFMTAGEINYRALREVHSLRCIGCFIAKPILADDLIDKIRAELE